VYCYNYIGVFTKIVIFNVEIVIFEVGQGGIITGPMDYAHGTTVKEMLTEVDDVFKIEYADVDFSDR